jgi:hypothetical protein
MIDGKDPESMDGGGIGVGREGISETDGERRKRRKRRRGTEETARDGRDGRETEETEETTEDDETAS